MPPPSRRSRVPSRMAMRCCRSSRCRRSQSSGTPALQQPSFSMSPFACPHLFPQPSARSARELRSRASVTRCLDLRGLLFQSASMSFALPQHPAYRPPSSTQSQLFSFLCAQQYAHSESGGHLSMVAGWNTCHDSSYFMSALPQQDPSDARGCVYFKSCSAILGAT